MSGRNFNWLLPDTLEEITSAPLLCYCGVIPDTPEMRVALRTAIHTLARARNWETKDGILAKDVALFMFQLEQGFHIDCCDLMRGCITDIMRPLLDNQNKELLEKLDEEYGTNGEAGIAPNLIYNQTADDILRDLVVCYMCRAFVNLVFDAEIKRRQDQRELTYWQLNFLSDFAVIVAPFLGPLAAAIALGAAIGLKIAAVAEPLAGLVDEVLNDDTARDLVACCMTVALRGATPSLSRFQTSLSGCGFGLLQNAEYMRQILEPLVQDVDVYMAFLATGNDIWPYVEQGLLDVCPCEGWSLDLLLTATDGQFTVWDLGNGAVGGVWVDGDGWETTNTLYSGAPDEARTFCSLEMSFVTPVAVDGIEIWGDVQFGTWADTSRPSLYVNPVGSGIGIGKDRNEMTNGDFNFSASGSGVASGIQMYIRASRDISSPYAYDGIAHFTRIRLTGTGTPPVIS